MLSLGHWLEKGESPPFSGAVSPPYPTLPLAKLKASRLMPKQVASVPEVGGGEAGPGLQARLSSADPGPLPFTLGLNPWYPRMVSGLHKAWHPFPLAAPATP